MVKRESGALGDFEWGAPFIAPRKPHAPIFFARNAPCGKKNLFLRATKKNFFSCEKNWLTPAGLEPTTTPSKSSALCRLSYGVKSSSSVRMPDGF
jgi:hypothetical protein